MCVSPGVGYKPMELGVQDKLPEVTNLKCYPALRTLSMKRTMLD